MDKRVVRKIEKTSGVLSNRKSNLFCKVRFDLTQYRRYLNEVPTTRSAHGNIEIDDLDMANTFFVSGDRLTLSGGGIEADVYLRAIDSFIVTGPIRDTPPPGKP
jgi:hypothetical protein